MKHSLIEPLESRIAPAALSLSIANPRVNEGNPGDMPAKMADFTVTLDMNPDSEVTVHFTTLDGTATVADGDYAAQDRVLTFSHDGPLFQVVHVAITGDAKIENDETFSAKISEPTNATITSGQDTKTATIATEDAELTINNASIIEGDSGSKSLVFTVTRGGFLGNAVTFDYSTVNGTATAGTDFTPPTSGGNPGFAKGTITAGTATTTISIPILGDLTKEGTENFSVVLSNATNAVITDASGEGTIFDNGDPNPSVSISDATAVFEGADGMKTAVFRVSLSGSSNLPITVNFATMDGTAMGGSDFQLASKTLTFNPGEPLFQNISVPITGDAIDEADEIFSAKLSNATNATIARDSATGTILNDDLTITIDDNLTIPEGDSGISDAVFNVHLSSASTHAVRVHYTTKEGTLTGGATTGAATVADGDYVLTSGDIDFAPGQTLAMIHVPIRGDTRDERADEKFTVELSAQTNAIIGDATATGRILNDDFNPGITIDDLLITEGDSGNSNATFTVHLAKPSTETVTVNFTTNDGTAIDGVNENGTADYVQISGQLTFAPGVVTQTVTVQIHGDKNLESDETFTVDLSSVSANATLAKGSAVGSIHDVRTITINDVTKGEGVAGTTTNFPFTVTLDGVAEQAITVDFATADGTATVVGGDYAETHGMLTFAAGDAVLAKTVNVTVNGDDTSEPDEIFTVKLSGETNATLTKTTGTGRIQNDESTFKIVSAADANSSEVTVLEGSPGAASPTNAVFTIVRSGDLSQPATVQYSTVDGTAVSSGARPDFTATSGAAIFAANEATKTITIPITQDTNRELQEMFTVVLSGGTGGAISDSGKTGTVKITDDDSVLKTISILDPAIIDEGDTGERELAFIVRLSGADETGPVTVHFQTTDGTAISTGTHPDFTAFADTTLTFAPGVTEQTVKVKIQGDVIDEADLQTFAANLSNAQGATILDAQADGVIRDNDTATILFGGASNGDVTLAEGNAGTTDATFTVKLSTASETPVSVKFSVENGTAISTGAAPDFAANPASGTLTFAPDEVEKTVVVKVTGDMIFEQNENFNVRLTEPSGATIADALAVGTITNDDAAPVLSIDNVAITEGDSGTANAVFTVMLTGAFQNPVTFNFATADDTAKAGVNGSLTNADYLEKHGSLTFVSGEATKMIAVAVVGDLFKEVPSEKFTVNLSNAQGATLSVQSIGTATIADNDTKVGVSIADVKVVEGNFSNGSATQTAATFQIELTGPADAPVTFTVATSDSTAIAGSDYLQATRTITIPAGSTTATFQVAVLGDSDFEFGATESFSAKISNLSANAQAVDLEATGYIYNDDRRISANGRTVQYMDVDGDVATITVSKSGFFGNLSEFQWKKTGAVGGEQLEFVNLRGASRFAGANLSVTAAPAPGFPGVSDGKVNVGWITAAVPDPASLQFTLGIDLGTVFVEGDLARIDAGDNFVSAAIGKLEVGSFGAVAGTLPIDTTTGQAFPNQSSVLASISRIIVHGDFAGELQVFGDQFGDIGSLQIDGALTGSLGEGRIFFSGTLGTAVIGSIVGGSGADTGRILGNTATHANIGTITVLGDVAGGSGHDSGLIHAERIGNVSLGSLHGGTGLRSGSVIADGNLGRLGSVKIKGDVVGVQTARAPLSDAAAEAAAVAAEAAETETSGVVFGQLGIGNVSVGGSVRGGVPHNSGSIISNGGIASVTIGKNLAGGSGTGSGSVLAFSGAVARIQIGTALRPGAVIGSTGEASGFLLMNGATSVKIFGDIIGGTGDRSGGIDSRGALGSVIVTGNITGGNSTATKSVVSSGFISATKIGSILVNGDLIAGTKGTADLAASGAIRASDTIGSLTIKGSVIGNATNSALISAGGFRGNGLAASALVLSNIKLATDAGKSVRFAEILAGYGSTISAASPRGTALNPDAQIGSVFIGGAVAATNIIAGAAPGTDGRFGTADDALFSGNIPNNARLISKIASVVITGAVENPTGNNYGIVAQQIGSIKLGTNTALKLPASSTKHLLPIGDAALKFTAVQLEQPV